MTNLAEVLTTTALLVVEVAVTSRTTDTEVKPALYAAAGVPELWVVDVPGRRVERFRDPDGRRYASRSTHVPPERLRPVAVDVPPLDLGELLAGL
jgi:Uma2 family endonuclease